MGSPVLMCLHNCYFGLATNGALFTHCDGSKSALHIRAHFSYGPCSPLQLYCAMMGLMIMLTHHCCQPEQVHTGS